MRRSMFAFMLLFPTLGFLTPPTAGSAAMPTNPPSTAYDFDFVAIDGQPLPLKQFAGKAMLVVNTASMCGYTPQYADLQALWEQYRDRGLIVLGVRATISAGRSLGAPNRSRTSARSTSRSTSRGPTSRR